MILFDNNFSPLLFYKENDYNIAHVKLILQRKILLFYKENDYNIAHVKLILQRKIFLLTKMNFNLSELSY